MPYLFVGAGQAGSAIVDDIFDHQRVSVIASPIAFNSTVRDLENLSNIDSERWYGIAAEHGFVEGTTPGFEEQVTGGFGRNPVRADEVIRDHEDELRQIFDVEFGDADIPFAFIFLGLGGGTGCGIAPYLADAIKEFTGGIARVIAVGVLPNTSGPIAAGATDASDNDQDDSDRVTAPRQAWNTIYGLDRLEQSVDGILLVDNQRLAYEDAAEGRFKEFNEYIAGAVIDLIAGAELEGIDPGEYDAQVPNVDVQDLVTSISFDVEGPDPRPGYASIGRAITMTKSLAGYFIPFLGQKQVDSAALPRLAMAKLSLSDASGAVPQKALGVIRAPERYLTESDYRIESSTIRGFLESRTELGEVNLGMAFTERNLASLTTVVTFEREDIDRLAEIENLAEEHETEAEIPSM